MYVKHDLEIDVCQYIGSGENFLQKEIPTQILISQKELMIASANPLFAMKPMQSLDEKIKSLEILDILKDMPLPLGMAELLKNDLIKDPETARAAVEAFKAMDKLMRKSSGGSIVDSVPGLPSS